MMITLSSRVKPPLAAGPNAAHPLARRLAGCWLLHEGSGQVVHDVSGSHRDGSFSGGPVWAPGAFGPAVVFDGYDDWISMGNCLDLGTDDVTLLALVQYSADQPEQWQGVHIGAIAGKGHLGPNSNGYGLSINLGNKICWQVRYQGTALTIASDNVLNDGRWHLALGVCDRDSPTGVRLYIDGVLQTATADPTSIVGINVTDPAAFAVGSRQDINLVWQWDYLGRVAVVGVWKRVLTEAEIGRLQCEPFVLFARRRTPGGYGVPAGAVVDLAGTADAVSSAAAALRAIRGLAGLGAARATGTAILRTTGAAVPSATRPRLRDALAHGMTATAFKLGTTLTQGWFWVRQRGAAAVYRGRSLAQVDVRRILHVAGPESGDITLPTRLAHPAGSTHCYLVRRFNGHGTQERTDGAAAIVCIGSDGQLAPPAPNPVVGLRGEQVGGRRLRLTWSYWPLEQGITPQEFRVYWNGGAGPLDLEHPLATVPYAGCRSYQWETEPLGDGPYTFAVRSCGINQAESIPFVHSVGALADLGPDAPTILSVEAV